MDDENDRVANRTRKRKEASLPNNANRTQAKRIKCESDHDYSKLPTEILLKIFGYFKKEDNVIKTLTETCYRFKAICDPLLFLNINYDRILRKKENYPVIKRSYDLIRIRGSEIDPKLSNTKALLASSAKTAKCLYIGDVGESRCLKTVAHLRTIAGIIGCLPEVREIQCSNVKPTNVQLQFEALREVEFPSLKSLRKLHLKYCQGSLIQCFNKATEIEDFQWFAYNNRTACAMLKPLTVKQKNLETLRTVITNTKTRNVFKKLKTLEYPAQSFAKLAQGSFNILKNAPNIENIKLIKSCYDYGYSYSVLSLIACFHIPTLKKFEIEGRVHEQSFNLDEILKSFPALQSFDSTNLSWKLGQKVLRKTQAPIMAPGAVAGVAVVARV
jgi:F-box-like